MGGRVAVLGVALAACQFAPSGLAPGADGGAADGASPAGDARARADAAEPDAGRQACPADPELRACLTFDGDAIDRSLYVNPMSTSGLAFAAGRFGQALAAGDGVDVTFAETPVLDPAAALTLEAWLYADYLPADGTRMAVIDNNGQWGMFVHPSGRFVCAAASTSVTVDNVIAQLEWHHVVCTYDGLELLLYRDGVVVGRTQTSNPLNTLQMDGTAVGRNLPLGDYFHGRIDEVRVWGKVVAP